MRYLFILMALLLRAFYSNIVYAYTCTPASSYTITIPTLNYPSTGLPNDKIGPTYMAETKQPVTCTDTTGITSRALKFKAVAWTIDTTATDGSQIFWTNGTKNGIGYAIGADATCGTGGFVKPYTSYTMGLCAASFTGNVTPKIQFYQTAYPSNITATTINNTYAGDVLVYINGIVAYKVPVNFTSAKVQVQPCKVTTSSVSVPMGTFDKRLFTSVGTIVGGSNFNISLSCTKVANVSLQIDPSGTSPGKSLGLVPINTGSGAATGVAIQLINNQTNSYFRVGSPIALNKSTNGIYNISLRAQYFQTAVPVTAGAVNASATFTVTYP